MPTERGWAIAGTHGLYTGWHLTRKMAILDHVASEPGTIYDDPKERWERCRKKGDRAVRVTITYTSGE